MDAQEGTWIQKCVSRKVLSLVAPYCTYTRALTLENFCYSAVGQTLTFFLVSCFFYSAVGQTLTFSAYALIILDKPIIITTATSPLPVTTPPPRVEQTLNIWGVWWMFLVFGVCGH